MCSTRQRLAALLREQRSARGITLRLAAQMAGLAPSTLSRWEAGACLPRVPELEALLKSFGVGERDVTRILMSLDAPRAAMAVRKADIDGSAEIPPPSGGELLSVLRVNAGLSASALAEALGVSPSTVSRWESGSAHPSSEHIDQLLDLLGANDDERTLLAASGVAKLKFDRPPYDHDKMERDLHALEACIPEGAAGLELSLLKRQTMLWWYRDEPGAADLLRQAIVMYAEFLVRHRRYREGAAKSQTVLDSCADPFSEIGIRAFRARARADVYRWPIPRPHSGLYTLQGCLNACALPSLRVGILQDMAEYSRLAGRHTEAADYASRAAVPHPSPAVSSRPGVTALALASAL